MFTTIDIQNCELYFAQSNAYQKLSDNNTDDDDDDDTIESNFFDSEFTLATATAASIWESTWRFIQLFREQPDEFGAQFRARRVVELGCGVGALGLVCAGKYGLL